MLIRWGTMPRELSRGARDCLRLIRWYAARHTRVFPSQAKLAKSLNVSDRQVRKSAVQPSLQGNSSSRSQASAAGNLNRADCRNAPYRTAAMVFVPSSIRMRWGFTPVADQ
jgi:hypothetical protein